jgi:RNA polymerase sigma-70 factor (ECF subfamily)
LDGSPAIDEQQLVAIVDEHLPQVYRYLLRRVSTVELAEDLTSETFLAAWRSSSRGEAGVWSTPWLIAIARNKLVDHWRRQGREERYLAEVAGELRSDVPLGPIEESDADAILVRLNPSQRAALVLHYYDGLPVAEVATLLGRSTTATENLLARARAAFRRIYDGNGGEIDA